MFKKSVLSVLGGVLALTGVFNIGNVTTVEATGTCTTIAQCRERQREAQDNIANLLEEEEEVGEEIAVIRAEMLSLRADIDTGTANLAVLEAELDVLRAEIDALIEDISANIEIKNTTDARIEVLLEEVAQRMRLSQHTNNRNAFIVMISEAESFVDLIRQARFFTGMAATDASNMEELTTLLAQQELLLATLNVQEAQARESREQLEENVAVVEAEQNRLNTLHYALSAVEYEMLERLYAIGANIVEEEELLASLEAAEEVLARTPPPPVVATPAPSASGGAAQTANTAGLAHPLPGARVSSNFGPRWGGWHGGIDVEIFSWPNAPILAAASGTVTLAEWHWSMGWWVIISHNINGQRIDTVYAHLRYTPMVSPGDVVSQGQQIGNKGNTGQSFGAHLHFEVHRGAFSWNGGENPRNWINF